MFGASPLGEPVWPAALHIAVEALVVGGAEVEGGERGAVEEGRPLAEEAQGTRGGQVRFIIFCFILTSSEDTLSLLTLYCITLNALNSHHSQP